MHKQLTAIFTALLFALPFGAIQAADRVVIDSNGAPVSSTYEKCVHAMLGSEHKDCMPAGEMDSDGDGVADAIDKCLNTPAGSKVDATGCVIVVAVAVVPVDSDGDGVFDDKDQCPGTPAGAKVNEAGCAVKIVMDNLNFENNSSALTAESKQSLDPMVESIKAHPNVEHITIVGHTDGSGAASYNQMLSEKRANSVRDYLINGGVNGSMLTAKGAGETTPIASNSTREGRAKNRRVEFDITWK